MNQSTQEMVSPIDDLYHYNDWANGKVLSLCVGLSEEQLDSPKEIGFGSLRATLFHILAAEQIWLERWRSDPWRAISTDPHEYSLDRIKAELAIVANDRREFVDKHRADQWNSAIDFNDSEGSPHQFRLFDLLMHVGNHGIHHRAQALNYLRKLGCELPVGIDYAFYRLAQGNTRQTKEAKESLTRFGLEVNDQNGRDVEWNADFANRLFEYSDWATDLVFEMAKGLVDEQLDYDFEMGPGSIRKTLLHLYDAECWWFNNSTSEPERFSHSPETMDMATLVGLWRELSLKRNDFVSSLDSSQAERVVGILVGGPPTNVKVGESILHLGYHGTHHRAQIINMLRRSNVNVRNIDLLYSLTGPQLPGN